MKLRPALEFALMCLGSVALIAVAAPLAPSAVPEPLKTWVPWVLHGHERVACPAPFNSNEARACVWSSRLELQAAADGATFRFEVQVFGAPALVELPGEPGRWPQGLQVGGVAVAGTAVADRPAVQLAAGRHVVTGTLAWAEMPQDLLLPRDTGVLQLTLNGRPVPRTPDADGRVWLQRANAPVQASDALTVRTSRLVEDDIPLRVTTHFDIAIAGTAREVQLPAALLPGFIAESIESAMPARLQEGGLLRLQGRPGRWTVAIRGRLMAPTASLAMPADLPGEIWSFAAHNDLRLATVEGLVSVDPKQVPIPDAWRRYPAYQVQPGQAMKLVESRRGNPQPGADRLTLARQIWLDFDGSGYTVQDAITGTLSRSWRLDVAAPFVLGRASADRADQPVTRRAGAAADGVELRQGRLALSADSRVEGALRTLPATGWQADFNAASVQLHLPPGWRLLHASGVDQAEGSWVARWSLWDFFFVLLSVLAAARLFGAKAAVLVAGALVFTWHMPDAPQAMWLVLIGLLALVRVLPAGRLLTATSWGARVCVALLALWLVPYAVHQVRLSMYPTLEHPQVRVGDQAREREAPFGTDAAAPAAAPAPAPERVELGSDGALDQAVRRPPKVSSSATYSPYASEKRALDEVDPNARVQTGPGLPAWHWNTHRLVWQGPVQAAQSLGLALLPPAGTALLRLGGLALMVAALWALARGLPQWPRGMGRGADPGAGPADPADAAPPPRGARVAALLMGVSVSGLALALAFLVASPRADAAPSPPAPTLADAVAAPDAALLDALRGKLTAPPDCLPQCADVARLRVEAQGARVQLRLEVHALADTMVPLPGQGANWRPTLVMVDGLAAVTRREAGGALWLAVRAGVRQVLLVADVGEAASVEIALPMVPREVVSQTEGWALAGLDARGLASSALSLSRSAAAGATNEAGTPPDALPPFVRVERTLRLGLRWSVETRVTRLTPSRAPVRVRVALLAGEAVNDAFVRIEDGHAVIQLGAEDEARYASTVKEATKLEFVSGREPNQVEVWRLEPSAQWHAAWSGIAPVQYLERESGREVGREGGRLMPTWQPWPGERVTIEVDKPAGAPGQTLTIDRLSLRVSPGLRATDVTSTATLRSSQGGNHRTQLPEGAEFLGLSVDGQAQPVQPQGRELLIPIAPGAHQLKIDWREPRGMGGSFHTTPFGLGAAGVNASTEIAVPPGRVVLAVGGPRIGPAVLIWGVLVALLGAAWLLGRSRVTPLGAASWFVLGLGLAQSSLLGAAVVGGWFFALAARRHFVADRLGAGAAVTRNVSNLVQLVLVGWTLLAAVFLFNAVRVGLLGYPDMLIAGNGSDAAALRWYQDRFAAQIETAWVVSAPVLVYRLLMLAWALWLAVSMLRWVRWAWDSFAAGGYWHRPVPRIRPERGPVDAPAAG